MIRTNRLRYSNNACLRAVFIATIAQSILVYPIVGLAAAPSGLTWSNHVNSNVLTGVEAHGTSIWFGSAAGGVVELDTLTGNVFNYTQSVHCLPSNVITNISVGANGDVWVATPRGAAYRPSGSNPSTPWIPITSDNSPLIDNEVLAVAAEPAGGAWLGTFFDGAFHFDGTNWTQYAPFNSPMQDIQVHSIEIDSDGAKWFGHFAGGVDRFDGAVWTNFNSANTGTPPSLCGPINPPAELGIISGFVRVLEQNNVTGDLWFDNVDDGGCVLVGATVFDGLDWATYTQFNSDIVFRTEDVAADPSGFTWIVSRNGIQQFDNGVITTISTNGAPSNALGVEVDSNGITWFATEAGIFELNAGVYTQHPPLGLAKNQIRDLTFRSTEDSVQAWVAHDNGVQKLDGATWTLLTPDNSPLSSFSNSAIAVDLDNAIWIGSSIGGAGVHRMNNGLWTTFTTANSGLISTATSDIEVDPTTGAVWFGNRFSAGLSVFDGEGWETFLPSGGPFSCASTNGVPGQSVNDIEIDNTGTVWIGSGCGLTSFDGKTWTPFTTNDGLADNNVRDIDIAADGSIWVGTRRGVSHFQNGSFRSWLTNRDVRTVTTTPDGPWISMFNVGIAVFDGIDWIPFGIDDGLVNNRVFESSETHPTTGQPWFGTEGGIAIVADLGLPGDLDEDGDVDADDLNSMTRCLAGPRVFLLPTTCSQSEFEAADLHGDGDVDLGDVASMILRVQER